jgi:hypothetical protein
VASVLFSDCHDRECTKLLENPVNNTVIAVVKAAKRLEIAGKRLRASNWVDVNLLLKLLLESVPHIFREALDVSQRVVGEL